MVLSSIHVRRSNASKNEVPRTHLTKRTSQEPEPAFQVSKNVSKFHGWAGYEPLPSPRGCVVLPFTLGDREPLRPDRRLAPGRGAHALRQHRRQDGGPGRREGAALRRGARHPLPPAPSSRTLADARAEACWRERGAREDAREVEGRARVRARACRQATLSPRVADFRPDARHAAGVCVGGGVGEVPALRPAAELPLRLAQSQRERPLLRKTISCEFHRLSRVSSVVVWPRVHARVIYALFIPFTTLFLSITIVQKLA